MTHDDLIEAMADRACPGRGDPLRIVAEAFARTNITHLCEVIPGLSDIIDGKAAIVPKVATDRMQQAAFLADGWFLSESRNQVRYAAMLAVSPYRFKNNDR